MALGISGLAVCTRAGIARSRLSDLEGGLAKPRPDELTRLSEAIESLAAAQVRMRKVASELGWPFGVV
jgi:transcriptional regulator with XRE-family HTH domain